MFTLNVLRVRGKFNWKIRGDIRGSSGMGCLRVRVFSIGLVALSMRGISRSRGLRGLVSSCGLMAASMKAKSTTEDAKAPAPSSAPPKTTPTQANGISAKNKAKENSSTKTNPYTKANSQTTAETATAR